MAGEELRLGRIEDHLALLVRDFSKLVEVQTHIGHILEDSRRTEIRLATLEVTTANLGTHVSQLAINANNQSYWLKWFGTAIITVVAAAALYVFTLIWTHVTGL